jgi:hypothetical protein
VSAGGLTSTLVGAGVAGAVNGVGTAARFNGPQGLALVRATRTLLVTGYPNVGKSSCINALLGITSTTHTKKRVAVAGLDSQPTFGHVMGPPAPTLPAPKAAQKGTGKGLKTSLDASELMEYEDTTPVSKGHEPHARLTNRIKLQLAGAIN